jgi:hypothetical protein
MTALWTIPALLFTGALFLTGLGMYVSRGIERLGKPMEDDQ